MKYLYALENDQGYLAHTLTGTGSPPKKNHENLKFGLKFNVLESITSGIVEMFSLNFFMRPAITASIILVGLTFFAFRLPEIDFALGLAAPGGLTSGSAMPV